MNNNAIEFVLKMKDLMSSAVMRAANQSQSSFGRMSQFANQATSRNQVLGLSFDELQRKIRQVEGVISSSTIPSQIAEARRELNSLQRMSARHSGRPLTPEGGTGGGVGIGGIAVGSMLGGFAMQAGSAIVGAVGSGIGAMVTKSMEKEQAITGLTTFLGKQGATDAYKNIRQDANNTTYGTDSLLAVNGALISTGKINAANARTDTMNLANAISATNPKGGDDALKRMAINMQQIKNNGFAQGNDIKEFGYAGINITEMLKRSGQKSEGRITYEMISKALATAKGKGGMYENALEAQAQTMGGKWSTVKDNIGTAASDIGDAFSPVINKLLDLGLKFANSIAPALVQAQPYIDMISNGVGTTVDFIMDLINGTSEWSPWVERISFFFNEMWKIISQIGIKLFKLVGSVIEFIKKSEILKDIFSFLSNVVLSLWETLNFFVEMISAVWEGVLKPILEKLDAFYKWMKGIDETEIKLTKSLVVVKPVKPEGKPPTVPVGTNLAMNNADAGKKAGESVVGGGPKTININVGKFFDNLQFTTLNSGDSMEQMERLVLECLGRVVYNGAKTI